VLKILFKKHYIKMSDRDYYPVIVSEVEGQLILRVQVNFTTTGGDVSDLYDSAMDAFYNGDYDIVHSELNQFEVTDSWDDFDEVG
jgi:hypothetical protein